MRTREIFLASLLTLTFGCPGDDGGGETGSHETDHDHETDHGTTSGSTGSPTTTPMDTSTTATSMDSSTTASMDGTSTTAPGESSSGGSSSGGAVNEVCEMFCADYFGVCGESADNDYGTEGDCYTTCVAYSQKELDCKVYHVSVADGPDSVHCGHANIDGGGTC